MLRQRHPRFVRSVEAGLGGARHRAHRLREGARSATVGAVTDRSRLLRRRFDSRGAGRAGQLLGLGGTRAKSRIESYLASLKTRQREPRDSERSHQIDVRTTVIVPTKMQLLNVSSTNSLPKNANSH